MSIVLQSSGGGQITLAEPTTASNFTQTLPAATGTVVISGTTPTLDGITFPATQVPSADANTLDDYEEGSFDAVVTMGSGSATVNSAYNRMNYTKIGRTVQIQGQFEITAVSSPSGTMKITLPFIAASSSEGESLSCGAVRLFQQNIPAGASYVVCWTTGAETSLYFSGVVSGAAVANVIPQVNGYFIVGITYTTPT